MEDLMLEGALVVLREITEKKERKKGEKKPKINEAYIVGGYVRDHILGVEANDIDITTNCLPQEIKEIFGERCTEINEEYDTAVVNIEFEVPINSSGETLIKDFDYEITTYRKDAKVSEDHRHSDIKPCKKLKTDVKRRDFTINSICMDKNLNIIDHMNGQEDLDNKLIRTIGDPLRRFDEDALRMLRCFRFASRFDFEIEEETYDAIKKCAHFVQALSIDEIKKELALILKEPYFKRFLPKMLETGIFKSIPEIEYALRILNANYREVTINDFYVLMTYFNGDIIEKFKLSKNDKKFINKSMDYLNMIKNRALTMEYLLDLTQAALDSAFLIADVLMLSTYTKEDVVELRKMMPIKTKRDLAVKGNDIIDALGIREQASDIKTYLDDAFYAVLYGKAENNKTDIIQYLKETIKDDLVY